MKPQMQQISNGKHAQDSGFFFFFLVLGEGDLNLFDLLRIQYST